MVFPLIAAAVFSSAVPLVPRLRPVALYAACSDSTPPLERRELPLSAPNTNPPAYICVDRRHALHGLTIKQASIEHNPDTDMFELTFRFDDRFVASIDKFTQPLLGQTLVFAVGTRAITSRKLMSLLTTGVVTSPYSTERDAQGILELMRDPRNDGAP